MLLLLATVFDGTLAREWQHIATGRISRELAFSFTDESVHVENSPAYHSFVFKIFQALIKDDPADMLDDLAARFDQFSAKALDFITRILRPDGKLPPIGDTEQQPTADAYRETFRHTLAYQPFRYAHSQGERGLVPPAPNRVYPSSGYALFRDHWPTQAHYQKALHLIVKVGTSSRYHHQQDEGHVSLYAGGEDWLIDSGLYNYNNKDPIRKYMRGRPGHNVPIMTHASYPKEFFDRLSAWQVTDYSEDASTPFVTMALKVLSPVVHRRRVALDADAKVVEIADEITSEDGQPRNITLQWHIPMDKTIVLEDHQVELSSPKGNRLRITFEGATPDQRSVATGQKQDRVFSCISYQANQVEPSQVLLVAFKERTALQVTTRLGFTLDSACTAPPNPTQADPVEEAVTFANQAAQDGADVQALNILESTLHQAEERQQLARVRIPVTVYRTA